MTVSPLIAPESQSAAPSEPWSSEFDQVRATVQALQSAATLFVTPKTVETHLSRIYAKLGVHSRTQLLSRVGKA